MTDDRGFFQGLWLAVGGLAIVVVVKTYECLVRRRKAPSLTARLWSGIVSRD